MGEERTSIKEFYRSDWPMTMSMRVCFDWWLMWEGPTHYGWHIPKRVGLDYIRKQAEHEPMNEIVNRLPSWCLSPGSCFEFLSWLSSNNGLWPESICWNKFLPELIFKITYLLVYVWKISLPVYLCSICMTSVYKDQTGHQIPWDWSPKQL